jgi:hypothetical protein
MVERVAYAPRLRPYAATERVRPILETLFGIILAAVITMAVLALVFWLIRD